MSIRHIEIAFVSQKFFPFGMILLALFVLSRGGVWAESSAGEAKVPNRLINEKSPYLSAHADNLVNWYPWGDEAFKRARAENKLIFLSIGFSSCHWCHVMERESFVDPEVSMMINEHFIPILVDKEERPEVDEFYSKSVRFMTGSAGWPLTVFLTPEKKPLYGGTYFPRYDREDRIGIKTLLAHMLSKWNNDKEHLLIHGDNVMKDLSPILTLQEKKETPLRDLSFLDESYQRIRGTYDEKFGGFRKSRKFLNGPRLMFLLQYWRRHKNEEALDMVETTLKFMQRGGIYDHIGGGIHRYTTDRLWRRPHFEKMLYSQAQIARIFIEVYHDTGKDVYARTSRGIMEYVLRVMTNNEGGFFSAEDADSALSYEEPGIKKEGAFYLWSYHDAKKVLDEEGIVSKRNANIFCDYYGLSRSKSKDEKRTLYIRKTVAELAQKYKKTSFEIETILKNGRKKLFRERANRPRPFLDEKILTGWNGQMIATLSLAARILEEDRYALQAQRAAQYILTRAENKMLAHYYRNGEGVLGAYLEDYAFFIDSLIEIYQTTANDYYLKKAKLLTDEMLKAYWDPSINFMVLKSERSTLPLANLKVSEGAAVAAHTLLRLGALTANEDYTAKAQTLLQELSEANVTLITRSRRPTELDYTLLAYDFYFEKEQGKILK